MAIPGIGSLTSGTAYHYTNAAGLHGILKEKCLWASSALQMNDSSEIAFAIEVVREAVRTRGDSPSARVRDLMSDDWGVQLRADVYIASASAEQDLLTQWVHYGGALGYNVGIDIASNLQPLGRPPQGPYGIVDNVRLPINGWYRVLYKREEQLSAVHRVLDVLDANGLVQGVDAAGDVHLNSIFATLVPQFKHPAFADEREIRYIAGRQSFLQERHRPGAYGLVPYVELRAAPSGAYGATDQKTATLPLVSAWAGPTPQGERESARDALRRAMDAYGYQGIAIDASTIPYRYSRRG